MAYKIIETIAALITLAVAIWGAVKAHKAHKAAEAGKVEAAKAVEQAQKTELKLDGRLEELLRVSREASTATGHAAGVKDERRRERDQNRKHPAKETEPTDTATEAVEAIAEALDDLDPDEN